MNINNLIIPLIASISTLIGIIPTYFSKEKQEILINKSLSFSLGIMLTLSFISLIPEAFSYQKEMNLPNTIILLIYIVLGIILSQLIDYYLNNKISNNNLYKLGIISIIAMIIHNIPEGITTYLTTKENFSLGLKLSIAIALHNIPEGISIAIPIYYSTKSRFKAFILTLFSGLSELLGSIIALLFIKDTNPLIMTFILSLTAGIMIQISFYEIYPTIKQYNNKKMTYKYIIIGIITMFICHLLL